MTAPVVCIAGSRPTDISAAASAPPETVPVPAPQIAQGSNGTGPRRHSETPLPRLGHRPALDGLRGIAILGVIGVHAGLLPGGGAGVDIFFTLSGFLITCLLLEEHAATGQVRLKHFYMRRFLRLVPAFALLVLVHLVYCLAFYQGWDRKAGLAGGVVSFCYLANWSRAFKWIPHFGLGHTWSLAIEEQFYLVWPILLLGILALVKSRGHALRAVVALALAFATYRAILIQQGAPFYRIYNALDTRADALLIGCAAALLYTAYPLQIKVQGMSLLGAAASTSFLLLLGYFALGESEGGPSLYGGGATLLALGSAVVIIGLMYEPSGWRASCWLLKRRWLVWVGKISYGLYLWHFFVFYVFEERFPNAPGYLVKPLALGASFAVAAVSFYVLEKPILRLKNRFAWGAEPVRPDAAPRGAAAAVAQVSLSTVG